MLDIKIEIKWKTISKARYLLKSVHTSIKMLKINLRKKMTTFSKSLDHIIYTSLKLINKIFLLIFILTDK